MAKGLKFRIYEVEGLYYPSSQNKGADQLRGFVSLFSHMQRGSNMKNQFSFDFMLDRALH